MTISEIVARLRERDAIAPDHGALRHLLDAEPSFVGLPNDTYALSRDARTDRLPRVAER